jgi:hypothetical protein
MDLTSTLVHLHGIGYKYMNITLINKYINNKQENTTHNTKLQIFAQVVCINYTKMDSIKGSNCKQGMPRVGI